MLRNFHLWLQLPETMLFWGVSNMTIFAQLVFRETHAPGLIWFMGFVPFVMCWFATLFMSIEAYQDRFGD